MGAAGGRRWWRGAWGLRMGGGGRGLRCRGWGGRRGRGGGRGGGGGGGGACCGLGGWVRGLGMMDVVLGSGREEKSRLRRTEHPGPTSADTEES